jgi:hypothetical protein
LPLNYDYRSNSEFNRRYWWYVIHRVPGTLQLLERSALLTIEGTRRGADAGHATRTLQRIWSVLPWSDRVKEIDANNVVGVLEFNRDGHLLAAGGGCGQTLVWIYVPTKLSAASIMGTGGRRVGGLLKAFQDGAAWRSARAVTFSRPPDPTQRLVCGRQTDAS